MSLSSTYEAAEAVRVLFLQHYFQLAAFVFTFYDHIITLDQEVELIWKKRWSKSKVLYFLCRYIGDILVFCDTYIYLNQKPTDAKNSVIKRVNVCPMNSCLVGMRMTVSMAMLCTWISQFILQSRIQALYNSTYVSVFLYAIFAGEVCGLFLLVVLSMPGMEVTSQPFPGTYQCTFTKMPSYIFMFWVSVLLFDVILFFLALALVYMWWFRHLEEPMRLRCFGPSLAFILLRDNFGHCFSAFALYIVTVVVWLTAETRYASIPSCFSYSATTVMGTRLILNLCDAFHNPSSYLSRGISEWDVVSCFTCVPDVIFAPGPIDDTATTLQASSDVESHALEDVHVVGLETASQTENT